MKIPRILWIEELHLCSLQLMEDVVGKLIL